MAASGNRGWRVRGGSGDGNRRRGGTERHKERTVAFDRARTELAFKLQGLFEGPEDVVERLQGRLVRRP